MWREQGHLGVCGLTICNQWGRQIPKKEDLVLCWVPLWQPLPSLGLSFLSCTCSQGKAVLPGFKQEGKGLSASFPESRLPVQPHLRELETGGQSSLTSHSLGDLRGNANFSFIIC